MTLMTNNSNNSNDYDDLHLKIFRTLKLQRTLRCKGLTFLSFFSFFLKNTYLLIVGGFLIAKGVVYGQSTRARAPLKKEVKFVPFMTSKIRRSNYYGTCRQVSAKKTNFVDQRMQMVMTLAKSILRVC